MSWFSWMHHYHQFRTKNAVRLVLLDILVVCFATALAFLAWSEYSVAHTPHPVPAIHHSLNHAH